MGNPSFAVRFKSLPTHCYMKGKNMSVWIETKKEMPPLDEEVLILYKDKKDELKEENLFYGIASRRIFKIFSGSKSRYFAEKVCNSLDCELGNMIIEHFADGEFSVSYEESIRGKQVFLIQSTFPNSDNLMELLLMVDAAKRASAKSIVAVIPYFGWARQDRKDKPRVSIGAKLIADMLSAAGINRLITMDLHADQIQGFFDVPVDHLYASAVFLEYIKQLDTGNMVIATPDVGGTKRASAYSKFIGSPMVICYKIRKKANEISDMQIIGDVKGMDVLLIDDIVDTAGTITKAANLLIRE